VHLALPQLLQVLSVRLIVWIEPLLDLVEIRIDNLMDFGWKHRVRLVEQRHDVSARL
jgi:hypothetical protein